MSYLKNILQKLWLAITSDSNPFFKMGKTRHQKDGCSFYQVKFTWAWITLYPCFLDLMYASMHYFLLKKRNLLFIAKYFPFYDFSGKYLSKTWWYHEILIKNQSELKILIKVLTQSMTLIFYENISVLTSVID